MTSAHRLLALVAVASALVSRQANAQDSPPQGGDNQGGAPAPAQPAPPSTPGTSAAAPTTPGATYLSPLTGFGNPQSSNGTIGGGTSEVHRNNVAERMLNLPKDPFSDSRMPWRDIARGPR